MDFEIHFVKEKGYFFIKVIGDTSPDDIEKSLQQVFSNPDWRKGESILYDNRRENPMQIKADGVKKIADIFIHFKDQLEGSKIALVMPKDIAFGLGRMWESHVSVAESIKTNIFRSIDKAVIWVEEDKP